MEMASKRIDRIRWCACFSATLLVVIFEYGKSCFYLFHYVFIYVFIYLFVLCIYLFIYELIYLFIYLFVVSCDERMVRSAWLLRRSRICLHHA